MIEQTKHCLRNLTNLEGRDARSTFWWYVLALVILQFVAGMFVAVPMIIGILRDAFAMAESGAPPEALTGSLFAQIIPMLKNQMIYGAALGLLSAALFSAAFVRRLHDSNKPGWIVLVPLATTAFSQVFAYLNIEEMMQAMQAAMMAGDVQQITAIQQRLQGYSAVGYIGYLVVIVFGVMDSTAGPNQYGDAPAQF